MEGVREVAQIQINFRAAEGLFSECLERRNCSGIQLLPAPARGLMSGSRLSSLCEINTAGA